MKCLAVCQDELIIRVLDEILLPSFEVEFLVENKALAKRLSDDGVHITAGDLKRTDTYIKTNLTPNTCIIVEDNGRRSLRKALEALRDAGGTLIYVLGVGTGEADQREDELKALFPDIAYLTMAELFGGPLRTEFSRSLTRARVQQYQRYFSDADRVLILLHHDPDPDAMASGLAVRNLLRRTKTTAIIGAMQGVTRPENLRMANLLDIHVETITAADLKTFDRVALVDVQPHYFSGLVDRVDLVIDHHPETTGWSAMFKDIRPDYGSTCTILTEHLRAVDVNISERTATAMLYAIKSDTLFFNRQANRVDLEAFSYLYPLADAALIRKMEGAEITLERLRVRRPGHPERQDARTGVLRLSWREPARGLHPLRRRLLPAARKRQVDDHLGRRQRRARRVGAQPGVLAQRRRVRAEMLRGDRQRRRAPRDGQGGRPDGGVPPAVRQPPGDRAEREGAGSRAAVPSRARADRPPPRTGSRGRQLAPLTIVRASASASPLAASTGSTNCRWASW